jgi:hypothetical protein
LFFVGSAIAPLSFTEKRAIVCLQQSEVKMPFHVVHTVIGAIVDIGGVEWT